jgi:hypothetical protein
MGSENVWAAAPHQLIQRQPHHIIDYFPGAFMSRSTLFSKIKMLSIPDVHAPVRGHPTFLGGGDLALMESGWTPKSYVVTPSAAQLSTLLNTVAGKTPRAGNLLVTYLTVPKGG